MGNTQELRGQTVVVIGVVEPSDVAALAVHIMINTVLTGATYDIDADSSSSPASELTQPRQGQRR